jgi:uncharacterized protein YbaR (Trm112 family)
MVIQMSCPWCENELLVEDGQLRGEIRCDECAVAFSISDGSERESRIAEAA